MINGICFRNAVISGYNNLFNKQKYVDELNIFPVPDGDTGTNMTITVSSVEKSLQDTNVGKVAASVSYLALRAARGNSGVILSILLKGFASAFENLNEADGKSLVDALGFGVKEAYGTLSNPTEGTILTVARVGYEKGLEACQTSTDPTYVWKSICQGAKEALDSTPELLPILKRAGVVDAGGQGLLFIFEGMMSVFENGTIVEKEAVFDSSITLDADFEKAVAKFDEHINFCYCTEFIIGKKPMADKKLLKEYLESVGDCVLLIEDDEIIKVHVHTNDPGLALQKGLENGALLTVKIENMKEQNKINAKAQSIAKREFKFAKPTEEFGFVAVVAGSGLESAFKDLGCTNTVVGGQTMNPSTDDLVSAIQATPAKIVYVLPNNKNIFLAAQQASEIVDDRKVVIIRTRTIPQGISAMMAFNPSADYTLNKENMHQAAANVSTGHVTYAVRKSEFGGDSGNIKIKKNDIIALDNGKLTLTEKDPVRAVEKLAKHMLKKSTEFITLIYGEGISEEQAKQAEKYIKSKVAPHAEITLLNGRQPIYYFIIAME